MQASNSSTGCNSRACSRLAASTADSIAGSVAAMLAASGSPGARRAIGGAAATTALVSPVAATPAPMLAERTNDRRDKRNCIPIQTSVYVAHWKSRFRW